MPKIITADQKSTIKRCFTQIEHDRPDLAKEEMIMRLHNIFGLSKNTILKILQTNTEDLETFCGGKRSKTYMFEDYIFRKDLQRLIWKYNGNNEFYTIDRLLADAKGNLKFKGERTTLYKIIKSMGYKYKKVNGRKMLCERKDVLKQRLTFLRKYLQLKNSGENYLFLYLDETWIYQNGSSVRRWVHESVRKSNPKNIKSEGSRFTILHAGCEEGFVAGCSLLLHSRNNDADYHKTMDGTLFKSWILEQLLPQLAISGRKCVIIMDNAPYHSVLIEKPPTASTKKCQMQEWLRNHNVAFEHNMTKKQLWTLIQPSRNDENCQRLMVSPCPKRS